MIEINSAKKVEATSPDVIAVIQGKMTFKTAVFLSTKELEAFISSAFGIKMYMPKIETYDNTVASKVYDLNKELEKPEIHNKELAFAIQTNGRVKGALDVFMKEMCLREIFHEGTYVVTSS